MLLGVADNGQREMLSGAVLTCRPARTALRHPEHGDKQIDCTAPTFGVQKFLRDNSLSMFTTRGSGHSAHHPSELAELLVGVQTAQDAGASSLSTRKIAEFGRRYDVLIGEGKQLNLPPPRTGKRSRPAFSPAGSWLDHQPQPSQR